MPQNKQSLKAGVVAEFKVRPKEKKAMFYTVRVFATKEKMLKYRANVPVSVNRHTGAFCRPYKKQRQNKHGKWITSPELGFIHFYKKFCPPSVVVHECVHAGLFYLRRMMRKEVIEIGAESLGAECVSGREEELCHAIGEMVRQCNYMLYKTGVWSQCTNR